MQPLRLAGTLCVQTARAYACASAPSPDAVPTDTFQPTPAARLTPGGGPPPSWIQKCRSTALAALAALALAGSIASPALAQAMNHTEQALKNLELLSRAGYLTQDGAFFQKKEATVTQAQALLQDGRKVYWQKASNSPHRAIANLQQLQTLTDEIRHTDNR